ncbi:MAG: amino acid permease [Bacteroidetes bacterium]|nr:amino acid permease [Bacteroidota bacterium]
MGKINGVNSSKIGVIRATSLVAGNMIGSGVFLLPATLALYGGISILGWIFSALGALVLAKVFSNLSILMPSVGGPYAYSRKGLGDFAGFLVAWGYWVSLWIGNAAITVAFISYLTVFIPELATNNLLAIVAGIISIWFFTWINTRGVKEASTIQLVLTILKITPLALIAIFGIFFINWDNFFPFNISGESNFSAITATATLTLWAFLGLESATIPADNIINPTKNIPRATLYGTLITTLVYVLGSMTIIGMIPSQELQVSNAPFADAAAILWGESARYWMAGVACLAVFGVLNGWILLQGQIPLAISRDKLFPAIFARENKKGAPVWGIVISSVLITVVMMMNYTKGLVNTFKFLILIGTITVLIPYLFSAVAYSIMVIEKKFANKNQGSIAGKLILAFLAFSFSIWAIAGSGEKSVFWGFLLLLAGLPVYVWIKWKNLKDQDD